MALPVSPQDDEGDDGEAVVGAALAWVAVDPGVVEGEGQRTACSLRRWVQGLEVEDPLADREQCARAEAAAEADSSPPVKGARLALQSAPCGGPWLCGRPAVGPRKGAAPLSEDAPCLGLLGCTALGAVLAEGARRSWVVGAGVVLTGQSAVLTRPPQ